LKRGLKLGCRARQSEHGERAEKPLTEAEPSMTNGHSANPHRSRATRQAARFAVGLDRVSTAEQGQSGLGLEAQHASVRAYLQQLADALMGCGVRTPRGAELWRSGRSQGF
jgi:hypothetical protein